MTKRVSRFFAAAAALSLVACGGSDGGPNYASEISEEDMGGAAEASYGLLGDVVGGIVNFSEGSQIPDLPLAPAMAGQTQLDRLMTGIRSRAIRRATRRGTQLPSGVMAMGSRGPMLSSSACEPVISGVDSLGNWIDSDDDGAPDDFKATFPAGCSITDGDWTYTYSGAVRLRDQPGLFGFRIDLINLKYTETYDPTGDGSSFTGNGSEIAVYAANGVDHDANLAYKFADHYSGAAVAGIQTSAAPSDFSIAITWIESTSFDPDGTITTESIGSGDFSIDLDFRAVLNGTGSPEQAFRFHLTTPTVLHYDASSCYGITSGVLRGALNSSSDIYFLVTWTGCDTTTFETHGTTGGAV